MKRYRPLAVVLVVFLAWCGVVWLKRSAPKPPPPDPSTAIEIVGPSTVQVGELVVYTTSEKAKYTKWITVPDGPQVQVTNEGQVLVIVFNSPGEYHIVLASAASDGVGLTKVKITVDGEGPDPPRPPPIPPEPPTPPTPPDSDWAEWTKASVLKIKYRGLKANVADLSGQLSSYAAQIAAGAVEDVKTARVRIRQITNSTLGANAKYWLEFSKEYAKRTKEFSSLREYQIALAAIAVGLGSAADSIQEPTRANNPYDAAIKKSKVDKRPIMVVITSSACPPCDKLKSEWLPNTKANGEYRLVMLDRFIHKDVVETVGTRGMKGSIKVPQVHILRYVGGTWRQFSRVGYTSYSSEDRWVKSVFAWEDE